MSHIAKSETFLMSHHLIFVYGLSEDDFKNLETLKHIFYRNERRKISDGIYWLFEKNHS